MRVLFVSQNFHIGGIAKALVNTINEMSEDQLLDIDLFTFSGGVLENDISNRINIIHGKRMLRVISTPFSTVLTTRNIIDIIYRIISLFLVRIIGSDNLYRFLFRKEQLKGEYDIAISYFHDNPNTYFYRGTNQYVADWVNAKKKIAWIHTDPINAGFRSDVMKKTYQMFDSIVCVSNECKKNFSILVPELADRTEVVYNFTPITDIKNKQNFCVNLPMDENVITLVSLGRIDNISKRYDMIPNICKYLSCQKYSFKWIVIGDGPDLENNVNIINEMGLKDQVIYIGAKANPYPYLKKADMLIILSAYEGYPMVIGEAFTLGVPVYCTPFAAAKELVPTSSGWVCPGFSCKEIGESLDALLSDKKEIMEKQKYLRDHPQDNSIAKEQLHHVLFE